jgi:tRNA dimethylallyltransferase
MSRPKVKSQPLLVIIGPTASGKTDLGLKLAKKFKAYIISADSRQLYKYAPIGTNQPVGEHKIGNRELRSFFGPRKLYLVKNVPHFFINTTLPTKTYSAAEFQKEAYKLLNSRFSIPDSKALLPILVGGTGLYVSAITEGYEFPSLKANPKLRKILARLSTPKLLSRLERLDPSTYQSIDKNNRQRLIRALEYVISSGQSFILSQKRQPRPNTLILGLNPSKEKLRLAIAKRTDQMLKNGLLKETTYLAKHYPKSILLKTIGYQEVLPVLKKQRSLEEARTMINNHTWQYARRQLTWFRKMPNITWVKNYSQAENLLRRWLAK